jgi:CRP-like cAMP-binding protein
MYEKWSSTLEKVDLFKDITFSELENMFFCLRPNIKQYQKDEIIALEGDDIKNFGILLEGKLMLYKEKFDGTRVLLKQVHPGQLFGEIASFSDKRKWPAQVQVAKNSTVMFMPPEKITNTCTNLCRGHRMLTLNMIKIISKKAINLNKTIEYLSVKSIRQKIAYYLLEQYKKTKSKNFMLDMNRNELSDFLNVTRPSLSREMANMRDEGLIDFHRSSIKLLNIDKLSSIV